MVRKAVIVAAGYGTRFLPVSRVVPKELLPLGGRPTLDWVVEELANAGIDDILVITSRRKRAIDDWFDRDVELETALPNRLADLRPRAVRTTLIRQPSMAGTGHALLLARGFAGSDPVVVVYPDDLFEGTNPTAELVAAHAATGRSALLALDMPHEDVSRYGVIDVAPGSGSLRAVRRLVEKPPRGEEPSHLVSLGRYLLLPAFFDALTDGLTGHTSGEYHHVPALNVLAARGDVVSVATQATYLDTGTPSGWLRAAVRHESRRDPAFAAWLREGAP